MFVYGESTQDYLVAIVVPSFDYLQQSGKLREWALENTARSDIARDPRLHKLIQESLTSIGEKVGLQGAVVVSCYVSIEYLPGFEKVKFFHVHPEEFTPESGLLTPSFKLKRHQLKQFFQKEINAMYTRARL